MKHIFKKLNSIAVLAGAMLFFTACNKELPEAEPIEYPTPSGQSIMEKLNDAEYSILKAAITKASTFNNPAGKLSDILNDKKRVFTFFAPDNTALATSFTLLGLPANETALNFLRNGQLDSLLRYHLIGGEKLTTSRINNVAPSFNMYLQSMLILAQPSAAVPPGYKMPIFMGKQGGVNFVNNFPITGPDIAVANGVIHKIPIALLPPDKVLWQTIAANADNSYTYFRAAIIRADGGVSSSGVFQSALSTPNANFTVLVPTNEAFEQLLIGQITLALMGQGMSAPDASAAATGLVGAYGATIIADPASIPVYGPSLAAVVTQQLVQGLVAYHIVAKPGTTVVGYRNYTVNFPATDALLPTLVNASVPVHPGVAFKSTFTGASLTGATVKGLGNATASNVVLSPMPGITHDINHVNGVIQRIDQVLLPQ